ncbi:MAG: serine protease [Micropepsaceae bacterium]
MKVESILLTTVRLQTFVGGRSLTNATGFLFERGQQLFLVTCRHVLVDAANDHFPDRVDFALHGERGGQISSTRVSLLLYHNGLSLWRTCSDRAGDVDVAAIEIPPGSLPPNTAYRALSPNNLPTAETPIEVGQSILIVGYPLGFQDVLHGLPVVRQAAIASSYGLRFQGLGYFLTDARTHRGTSGAPVLLRADHDRLEGDDMPWFLLGVHSSRLDVGSRDRDLDEALGLNCAWYGDVLMVLTDARGAGTTNERRSDDGPRA